MINSIPWRCIAKALHVHMDMYALRFNLIVSTKNAFVVCEMCQYVCACLFFLLCDLLRNKKHAFCRN